MIYRLWYFIRETVVSLWRNLSLTLAAILTVGISLSLVGTSVLVREAPIGPPHSFRRASSSLSS